MLTTYFSRQTTQTTYYEGPAGPYLDLFTHWLAQRGYRHESIRRRLAGAAQFVTWAQSTGCPLQAMSPTTLGRFRSHLAQQNQLHRPRGQHAVRWLGAQRFFEFLQAQQIIAPPTSPTMLPIQHCLTRLSNGCRCTEACRHRPCVSIARISWRC